MQANEIPKNEKLLELAKIMAKGDEARESEIYNLLSENQEELKYGVKSIINQEMKQKLDIFANLNWLDWIERLHGFEENLLQKKGDYFFDRKSVLPNATETLESQAIRVDVSGGYLAFNPKKSDYVEPNVLYVIQPLAMHLFDFSNLSYFYGSNMFNVENVGDRRIPAELNRDIVKCYTQNKLFYSEFGVPLTEIQLSSLNAYD